MILVGPRRRDGRTRRATHFRMDLEPSLRPEPPASLSHQIERTMPSLSVATDPVVGRLADRGHECPGMEQRLATNCEPAIGPVASRFCLVPPRAGNDATSVNYKEVKVIPIGPGLCDWRAGVDFDVFPWLEPLHPAATVADLERVRGRAVSQA